MNTNFYCLQLYISMLHRFSSLLICLILLLFLLSCSSQKRAYVSHRNEIPVVVGQYKSENGKEILTISENRTFVCFRQYTQNYDVVVPSCDTIASGFWEKREGFLLLKNKNLFNNIIYEVAESKTDIKDSLAFKIVLPEEDALNYNIFRFIATSSFFKKLYNEFDKPDFSIKTNGSLDGLSFNFSIKNIAIVADNGKKSYQRPYFYVFENFRPRNKSSNFFTITVKNFTQCFYEAMDVDGEVVGIEGGSLIWRGYIYKKIK